MAEDPDRSLDGLALDEATATVAEIREVEPDRAREILQTVTEAGIVSRDGLQERLGHVAKLVATPESRVEFAAMELDSAGEVAEPVSELAIVQFRLDQYADRLADVKAQVQNVQTTLQALLGRADSDPIFEVARELSQLAADANQAQRTADELYTDLDEFQRWLQSDTARRERYEADLELVEAMLDELAAARDQVADGTAVDPGRQWFDATLRARVLALLEADLRTEFVALQEWADREGGDADAWADLGSRLDSLDERREKLATALEEPAEPDWHERFADRQAAFEAAVGDLKPPIDWGAVQSAFETHRPTVEPVTIE